MSHSPRIASAAHPFQPACRAGRIHHEVIPPSAPRDVVCARRPRPVTWRRTLLGLFVLAVSPAICLAELGPNAGGTLIVHDTGVVGSVGPGGPVLTSLTACAAADAEAAVGVECIWVVYAAFPAGGSPRLAGLTLPERFDPAAAFRDDSSPPHQDPILGFGALEFGTAGSNRCPGGLGACCRCDGACFVITEAECTALRGGGIWYADYGCDPNPCPLVSSEAGA